MRYKAEFVDFFLRKSTFNHSTVGTNIKYCVQHDGYDVDLQSLKNHPSNDEHFRKALQFSATDISPL